VQKARSLQNIIETFGFEHIERNDGEVISLRSVQLI